MRRRGLLTLATAAAAYTAPPLFAEAPETTLAIHPRWPCHGDDNKCFNSGVLPAVRDHAWYRPSVHYAQIVLATDARLADCFLRDLSLAVRAPHREAALKAAESLRGPDCPSHDLDVAGDNPRYGWSVG